MNNDVSKVNSTLPVSKKDSCPQLKGTILRIKIPAGTVINLLNLIEISSPSGICIIVRLPFLGKKDKHNFDSIVQAIKDAGGTIEIVEE